MGTFDINLDSELIKSSNKMHKKELSPYKSINQLITRWERYSHNITKLLFMAVTNVLGLNKVEKSSEMEQIAIEIYSRENNILYKAGEELLVFKGNIIYSPQTGKPIKKKEWKKLEQAIIKYLGVEKDHIEKKMIEDSFWLGTLISRMEAENRVKRDIGMIDMDNPDFTEYGYEERDRDLMEMAELECGIYLQNVTEKARGKIQGIIIDGIRQRKSKHEVFQDLWDQQEDINRDWDRVIRTETAMNSNNGMMLSELRSSPKDEIIYMKGISAPDACKYCLKLVNNEIVILKDAPPKGDDDIIEVEGKEFHVIWPGKTNYGRSPKEYWPANIIHPYCRCTWERWYPELEKYIEKLRI